MKKPMILIVTVMISAFLILPTAFHASAAIVTTKINDETLYEKEDFLWNNTTYVPLRAFFDSIGSFDISWDGKTKTASVQASGFHLTATVGESYIVVNGQNLYQNVANVLQNSRVYVPVRSLAAACSMDVSWDGKTKVCCVTGSYQPIEEVKSSYSEEDLYWLSRIIHAESASEPLEGKIAVGNVVLNRVRRSDYPNTVYGVIFDQKYGTQFTPVASGTIYNTPSQESVTAAKMCLEGYSLDSEMIFFINEKIATNNWTTGRTFVMEIGNHKFYK
ncbi:MAG: cell wall hydrolase [Eubacteriales bacterium]